MGDAKHEAPTIAAFVSSHDASHAEGRAQYSAFALGALSRGFTPLFEWCEAKHSPGVVQHAQDSLTLLAMRHMVSGRYLGRDQRRGRSIRCSNRRRGPHSEPRRCQRSF